MALHRAGLPMNASTPPWPLQFDDKPLLRRGMLLSLTGASLLSGFCLFDWLLKLPREAPTTLGRVMLLWIAPVGVWMSFLVLGRRSLLIDPKVIVLRRRGREVQRIPWETVVSFSRGRLEHAGGRTRILFGAEALSEMFYQKHPPPDPIEIPFNQVAWWREICCLIVLWPFLGVMLADDGRLPGWAVAVIPPVCCLGLGLSAWWRYFGQSYVLTKKGISLRKKGGKSEHILWSQVEGRNARHLFIAGGRRIYIMGLTRAGEELLSAGLHLAPHPIPIRSHSQEPALGWPACMMSIGFLAASILATTPFAMGYFKAAVGTMTLSFGCSAPLGTMAVFQIVWPEKRHRSRWLVAIAILSGVNILWWCAFFSSEGWGNPRLRAIPTSPAKVSPARK
jgi:hypothetical protein